MIVRVLLLLAFVGAALYIAPQLTQKSAVSATPTPSVRPIAVIGSPNAVASGVAGVEAALKQASQTGTSVPVTLRVTDADLTAAAQPYFPQSYAGITIEAPAVRLGPALTLSAKASSLLLSGSLVASATPYASDGRLGLRLDSASVGGMALPDVARTQLQQQMQSAINAAVPAKLQIATVNIAPGVATISGVALP